MEHRLSKDSLLHHEGKYLTTTTSSVLVATIDHILEKLLGGVSIIFELVRYIQSNSSVEGDDGTGTLSLTALFLSIRISNY